MADNYYFCRTWLSLYVIIKIDYYYYESGNTLLSSNLEIFLSKSISLMSWYTLGYNRV